MPGIDYMEEMNAELEDRCSELEELRSTLNYCKGEFESASKHVRDEYGDWIGSMEDWLGALDDNIQEIKDEIERELNEVRYRA